MKSRELQSMPVILSDRGSTATGALPLALVFTTYIYQRGCSRTWRIPQLHSVWFQLEQCSVGGYISVLPPGVFLPEHGPRTVDLGPELLDRFELATLGQTAVRG